MKASVIIVTKNRKENLRRTIRSALMQCGLAEVVVIDDGSTDGTSEMVVSEYQQDGVTSHDHAMGSASGGSSDGISSLGRSDAAVRLIRSDRSVGCIVQRNRAAQLASGNILFSIDDDAEFSSPSIVSDTIKEFDHPRIAAVAIPYVEPQKSPKQFQRAPGMDHTYLTDSFVGTAHALRKDVFLKLGGYREELVHQGEESDYCVRLLDAGYVVRLGSAHLIWHMEAAMRDWGRVDYYGARNTLLFAYQNVPQPYFAFHAVAASWNVAKWTLEPSRFVNRIKAIGDAYKWCLSNSSGRRPVTANTYFLFRKLRKKGPLRLSEVEPLLSDIQN